eukprot:767827-Hanusia_phi.AAC.4
MLWQVKIPTPKASPPGAPKVLPLRKAVHAEHATAAGKRGAEEAMKPASTSNPTREKAKEEADRGDLRTDEGGSGAERVGVGITFGQFHKGSLHRGALYVKHLQEGSSAHEGGRIRVGDVLSMVDGKDVYRSSVDLIQNTVLGPGEVEGREA